MTHERQRILCLDENILLLKDAFSHVMAKHPFTIDAFVCLPDHIHCVWTMPENDGDFFYSLASYQEPLQRTGSGQTMKQPGRLPA